MCDPYILIYFSNVDRCHTLDVWSGDLLLKIFWRKARPVTWLWQILLFMQNIFSSELETVCDTSQPKMYPHIKFGNPTSNNVVKDKVTQKQYVTLCDPNQHRSFWVKDVCDSPKWGALDERSKVSWVKRLNISCKLYDFGFNSYPAEKWTFEDCSHIMH